MILNKLEINGCDWISLEIDEYHVLIGGGHFTPNLTFPVIRNTHGYMDWSSLDAILISSLFDSAAIPAIMHYTKARCQVIGSEPSVDLGRYTKNY